MSMTSMMADMSTMSMQMASMSSAMSSASSSMTSVMSQSMTSAAVATSTSPMSGMGGMGGMGGMSGMGGMGGHTHHSSSSGQCQMQMAWNWITIDSCFLAEGWHVTNSGQFAGTCIGVFLWGVAIVLLSVLRRKFDEHIADNALRKLDRANPLRASQIRPADGQCVPLGDDCLGLEETRTGKSDIDNSFISKNASGNKYTPRAISLNKPISGPASVDPASPSIHNGTAGTPLMVSVFAKLRSDRHFSIRPNLVEQVARAVLYGFQYSITSLLALILMSFNGYVIISAFLGVTIGYLLLDWPDLYHVNLNNEAPSPVCC